MSIKQANTLSKEYIKSRIIKGAAAYWGYTDTDIESFDPIVKLLIEAFATEVYKLNQEINSSQVRILERLASLLTPNVYTGPRPAHAILHAKPVEPVCELHDGHQFYTQKKTASKINGPLDTTLDLFFVPLVNQKLFDAEIKYSAAGSQLYSFNENNNREFFLKSDERNVLNSNELWIGIKLNYRIQSLQDITFYFDWRNQPAKHTLYKAITSSRWYVKDKELQLKSGIGVSNSISAEHELLEHNDANTVLNEIAQTYDNRFMHVAGVKLSQKIDFVDDLMLYPKEFENVFSVADLKQLNEKLLWIKIKLPPVFSESILEDTFISLNCFPVVNKQHIQLRYRLPLNINIVPLTENAGFYFNMKSITNAEGHKYHSTPLRKSEQSIPGTYTIRKSGIERFDNRNAVDFLNYLLELLRDESGSFAALGQDFLIGNIRNLNQDISQLEQRIMQNTTGKLSDSTYVMVNPFQEGEMLYIDYWNTNGEVANAIRPGTKFDLYSGNDIQRNNILNMTNTYGGRNELSSDEALNAYRYALVTRNRIITMEDIRTFVRYELGNRVKQVNVEKGIMNSMMPNEGIVRCISISIALTDKDLDREEKEIIIADLYSKLENKSIPFTNFLITIK